MPTPNLPARCRHLHSDGRQCGSPALRGQPLCFQHRVARQPLPSKTLEARFIPQLPVPDDFLSIQRGIAEVLRLLAEEELTESRASTLLRGLSIASQNLARSLRHEDRQARRRQAEAAPSEPVTDLVNHPEFGPLALEDPATPIQQNQDHSVIGETFIQPEAPAPATRLAPYTGTTQADDFRLGQRFQRLEESYRDQRLAFIHEKTAELEAQFEARVQAHVEAEFTHRLAMLKHHPEHELAAA